MDFGVLNEIATSQVIFSLLFIALLWFGGRWFMQNFKEEKAESRQREEYIFELHKKQLEDMKETQKLQQDSFDKREEKLMSVLDKNTEQLENVANTLTEVQRNLGKFESRADKNFKEIWIEIEKTKKRSGEND